MSRQDRFSWFSARQQKPRRLKPASRTFGRGFSQSRRLHVEALEDRRMLAVITVTSTVDNTFPGGGVSLREAIQAANTDTSVDGSVAGNGADTIRFAAALSGQTIDLGGELEITEALTIDATALAQNVTIDANNNSRIFNITATSGDFTLAGLTLTGGRTTGDNANSNDTTFCGGAVRSLTTGNLTLDQSTVSGNSTAGKAAEGGGIFSSGSVTLTSSTISGNSTTGNDIFGRSARGGGIRSMGTVKLTSSTVSGNRTTGDHAGGGGIFSAGDITLTNSTVSGNSTAGNLAGGGGIFSFGTVTLASSTVSDNHAFHFNASVGGIANGNAPITITNSIVAGNTAGSTNSDITPISNTFSVNFSLLGTAVTPDAGGSGNIFSDNPLLGPLAFYGGPTETHSLLAGSMAIDAGDPGFDVGVTPNDQRGAPFVRGSGLRVDIGAYERQIVFPLNLTVDTNVDENDGDYSAGDLSLREAVGLANGSLGAETITFAASLSGDTIELGGSEIVITEALVIDATALAQNVTIDANYSSRIFNITAASGDFTLAGLTLNRGRANGFPSGGGAIRSLTSGNLTLDQSTVSGNSTMGAGAAGGGIRSFGTVTLTSSTVSGNSASNTSSFFYGGGGGIYSSGAVTLTSSTISGNSTEGSGAAGGGIRSSGSVTLNNSTVSGNSTAGSSANGGGIWSSGGTSVGVLLINSTITDNHTTHATSDGGGIWINSGSLFLPIIRHSIVSGNSSGSGTSPDFRPAGSNFTANFSLLGTFAFPNSGSGNIFNNNPQLGPLANNGGPTKTHAPLAGSPAINAGQPGIIFIPKAFDQRGAPFDRIVGGRIDIGAIEDQPIPVNSADFDGDNDIDGADFLAWQRGFGILAPNASPSDGDANGDQSVDGVDLGIWESQFGLPAPVAAVGKLSAISHQPSAELIDAVMAIELVSDDQVAEAPGLDDVSAFAETLANRVFAAEVFTPAGAIADDAERPDTNSNEDDETKAPWLADKLLEQFFG